MSQSSPPPIHTCMLRTNRLHHSCARKKKKKLEITKIKQRDRASVFCMSQWKHKENVSSAHKKKKGLHVTNFLHMFAEAPSLKTHSFFTLIFQGLPYDLKIFCLYQNKVIWMSMPNVSFQKSKKKKTRNKMISKKGEVSFFLNCALVKNSLKKEEKKKPSL